MTYSNSTPNYELPLYSDSDKPSWRGDVNETHQKLEDALTAISEQIGQPVDITAQIVSALVANNVIIAGGTGLTAKQLDELSIISE